MSDIEYFPFHMDAKRRERDAVWKRVFLCHATEDKAIGRLLWRLLQKEVLNPWMDEENLSGGQKWQEGISKAVQETDIVLICLSNHSINKDGYVQEEISLVLNEASLKPKDSIFLVPVLLERCPLPKRLSDWQCVTLFERGGYEDLLTVLTTYFGRKGAIREKANAEAAAERDRSSQSCRF